MWPIRASSPARGRSRINGCAPSRARRLLRLGSPHIPICVARSADPGYLEWRIQDQERHHRGGHAGHAVPGPASHQSEETAARRDVAEGEVMAACDPTDGGHADGEADGTEKEPPH